MSRSGRPGRSGTGSSRCCPRQCGPTRRGTTPVAGSRRAPVRSSQAARTVLPHRVPEQTLGLFEAALQVTDGADGAEIHSQGYQRLRDGGRQPVMMTLAPLKRDASTVWTRWLATVASTSGAPVMSMTATLARCVRTASQAAAVSCRAHLDPEPTAAGKRGMFRTTSDADVASRVRSVPRRPGRYGQLSGLFAVRDFAVHDRPARSAAARPAPAAGSLERVMGARMSAVAPTARSESGNRRHGVGRVRRRCMTRITNTY